MIINVPLIRALIPIMVTRMSLCRTCFLVFVNDMWLNVDITAFTPLGSAGFWLQALLCVLHLPPGCSADIPLRPHWSASQGAQRVLYRAESLATVVHCVSFE